jgi:hypothetical protein
MASPIVRRIVQVGADAPAQVVFEQKAKKGPKAPLIKKLGKRLDKGLRARNEAVTVYLARHEASDDKRRNGWLRDLPKNVDKARKAGRDTLPKRLRNRVPRVILLAALRPRVGPPRVLRAVRRFRRSRR